MSVIKPMSRKELCAELDIENRVLNSWLKKAGVKMEDMKRKRIFTPAQLKKFFEHIGYEPNK